VILRNTYIVTPYSLAKALDELPLELELEDGSHLRLSEEQGDEEMELRLVRAFPIKVPLEIEVEHSGWAVELSDGTSVPLPRLRIPDGSGPSHRHLDDVIDGLSFLTDISLHCRHTGRGLLVPEDQKDADLIEGVGSDEPFSATSLKTSIRTVSLVVDAENVQTLIGGPRIGVRLYADALRLSLPTSQFREFWRVLESAFGQKDKALVKSLAEYKPAKEIKFDAEELKDLLTLRGRASHAETSAPDVELSRVEGLCDDKLPRLRSLVERVILTKQTWGAPSGGVHNPAPPVMSYVNKNGGVVLIKNWKKQLEPAEGEDSD
jgi:hypothetical protein